MSVGKGCALARYPAGCPGCSTFSLLGLGSLPATWHTSEGAPTLAVFSCLVGKATRHCRAGKQKSPHGFFFACLHRACQWAQASWTPAGLTPTSLQTEVSSPLTVSSSNGQHCAVADVDGRGLGRTAPGGHLHSPDVWRPGDWSPWVR